MRTSSLQDPQMRGPERRTMTSDERQRRSLQRAQRRARRRLLIDLVAAAVLAAVLLSLVAGLGVVAFFGVPLLLIGLVWLGLERLVTRIRHGGSDRRAMRTTIPSNVTYEQARREHEWHVPERYNIAADVCDKHPPEKLAMVYEDYRGNQRRVTWREQRSLANRAANLLAEHGVVRGDRVSVCAPASPETAAFFLGTWKLGAILLSLSFSTETRGFATE